MFSIDDIIDIAITVEKNGERAYRRGAEQVADAELAALLGYLADQEGEHQRWLAALKGKGIGRDPDEELAQMGQGMLRQVVGDQAFSLDDVDFYSMESVFQLLEAAAELELDTVIFYQMVAGFVSDPSTLAHLETIIEEEKRHGRLLQEFIDDGRLPTAEELAEL